MKRFFIFLKVVIVVVSGIANIAGIIIFYLALQNDDIKGIVIGGCLFVVGGAVVSMMRRLQKEENVEEREESNVIQFLSKIEDTHNQFLDKYILGWRNAFRWLWVAGFSIVAGTLIISFAAFAQIVGIFLLFIGVILLFIYLEGLSHIILVKLRRE